MKIAVRWVVCGARGVGGGWVGLRVANSFCLVSAGEVGGVQCEVLALLNKFAGLTPPAAKGASP